MISDPLLASIRALAETGLVDRCDIQRYTETNTADGVTQSWTTIASAVPCLRSLPSSAGTERVASGGAQLRAASQWEIWLAALTDVTVEDRLVSDGLTFEVNAVAAISYEPLRRCDCTEVS